MLKRAVVVLVALASTGWSAAPAEDVTAQIVALERGALDRWGRGDPDGYVEIYDPEVTYFDPFQERRLDGLEGIKKVLEPIRGKVRVSRYDMLHPKVQRRGDLAVLSFNLVSYQKKPDGTEPAVARWNATAVYRRTGGTWKSIHVHWSFTQPQLKAPVSEEAEGSPPEVP
jgi:ketosteroid isomerase-like protein